MTQPNTPEENTSSAEDVLFQNAQQRINGIIQSIRSNTAIEANFSGASVADRPTEQNLRDLADALKENTSLERIYLNQSKMGDAGIAILAPALGQHSNLREILLNSCDITDDGVETLNTHLSGHPTLASISFLGNPISAAACHSFGNILKATPVFSCLTIGITVDATSESVIALSDAALEVRNPNLLSLMPRTDAVKALFAQNSNVISNLKQSFEGTPLGSWSVKEINEAYRRRGAIGLLERNSDEPQLPRLKIITDEKLALPAPEDTSMEALTTPGEYGLTLMENPLFWEKFEAYAGAMREAGTPFTKAQLFTPGRDGDPFIHLAVLHGKLGAVVDALAANCDSLVPADLFTAEGKPNALLELSYEHQQCPAIFSERNFGGQSVTAVRSVERGIREHLGPMETPHRLLNTLRTEECLSTGRGRE